MDRQQAAIEYEVFKGLSNPCPAVIDRAVNEVLEFMESARAICFSAWQGIGNERILKYVAKKMLIELKTNLFDVLIWVMLRNKGSGMKNFQLQVADKLQIPHLTNYDSDDEDDNQTVDEVLSSRIHESLKDQNFLLVHDGDWELSDLGRMGIPSTIRRGNYSMILVSSAKVKRHHQLVLMEELSDKELHQLLHEECLDIVYSLNFSFTPAVVLDCIWYVSLFDSSIEIETLLRFWYAEGFIGSAAVDIDVTFKHGKALLDELHDRHILNYHDKVYYKDRIIPDFRHITIFYHEYIWSVLSSREHIFRELIRDSYISSRIVQCVEEYNDALKDWHKWEEIERISFWRSPHLFPQHAPNCDKLLTIVNSESGLSKPFPDNFFENMKNVRVVSLGDSNIASLPPSVVCLGSSLKLLNLHACTSIERLPLSYLTALRELEVLDLSNTLLDEFPNNFFESLQSLRLLDLSNCLHLLSLPPSLFCLLNLEHLLLSGCEKFMVLPSSSSTQPLRKLKFLDISKTDIIEVPERFFQGMVKLKDLNLSFNSSLESLPTSISYLVSLKKLNLQGCSSLTNICPSLRHLSSSLEELNLSSCESLQDVKHISSSFRDIIPNLRALDLSYTPVNFISLKNHSNLDTLILNSNFGLGVLDLSGTKIRKFPWQDDPNLKGLTRIDLFGVKDLCKVDWKRINWLPQDVNWDQCGDGNMLPMHISLAEWRRDGNGRGTYIYVEKANIFETLSQSHSWIKGRFLVYICPCTEEAKRRSLPSQWPRYRYKDIHPFIRPSIPSYERWLGIERLKRFPKGISVVLSHAQFFSLHDEKIILRLSDLGIGNMAELKECWIERCQAMKVVFDIGAHDLSICQPVLRLLEKLRISDLNKLTNMCTSTGILKDGSFGNLKHLQLEYCPQVVTVFSSGVCLESLEVLEIKFCARLEEIFSAKVNAEGSLSRLHTLFLLELPSLKSIVHNVHLASLRKAHVKGCPMLRKLPLQRNTSLNCNTIAFPLVVTGESKWWEQLEWEDENVKQHISFNSWKPFRLPKQP